MPSQIQTISNRNDYVELVRKYGFVNTGGLLEEGCLNFTIPEVQGFIGYKIGSGTAVVLGDPVCQEQDKEKLAIAFQKECKQKGLDVVYSIASKPFSRWAAQKLDAVTVEFGQNYLGNPVDNPIDKTGVKGSLVRRKFKHALHEGATVKEYLGSDPELEAKIEKLGEEWLEQRKGVQVYLSHLNLFKDRLGKRWFYAQKGDQVVGVLLLQQLQSKNGWLLNRVMINNAAPHGVPELLVVATFQILAEEKCPYVVMGPVPAPSLKTITGTNPFLASALRFIYTCARYPLRLDRHTTFWDKFQLETEPSLLIFPHQNFTIQTIRAIFQVFNVGG